MKEPLVIINFNEPTIPNMINFFSTYYPNRTQVSKLILDYPHECAELYRALAYACKYHLNGIYWKASAFEVLDFFDGYFYNIKFTDDSKLGYYLKLII